MSYLYIQYQGHRHFAVLQVKAKPSDSPEIAELKSKLEKASFSLNELHMDKSEVQKELDMSKAKV